MKQSNSENFFWGLTAVQWTALGVFVAAIALGISYSAWRHPVSGAVKTKEIPPPIAGDIDYKDLASPAVQKKFVGKEVSFRAMFISEFTDTMLFKMTDIDTNGRIFLNHRDINYMAKSTELGGVSSDIAIPDFVLSVGSDSVGNIRKLKRGDIIHVRGIVESPSPNYGDKQISPALKSKLNLQVPDPCRIHVLVSEVKVL